MRYTGLVSPLLWIHSGHKGGAIPHRLFLSRVEIFHLDLDFLLLGKLDEAHGQPV